MHNQHNLGNELNARLDRIEQKLDKHLEHLSTARSDINWLKGHVKLTISILTAVVGGLITFLLNLTVGK